MKRITLNNINLNMRTNNRGLINSSVCLGVLMVLLSACDSFNSIKMEPAGLSHLLGGNGSILVN